MKISARNTLRGKVARLTKGAVNAEVVLSLESGDPIVAVITNESVSGLGLKEGAAAIAIIKASEVILGKGLQPGTISARNLIAGKVARVVEGAVNSEVVLRLKGGAEVASIITKRSCQTLELKEGDEAQAVIKASNVILAVE